MCVVIKSAKQNTGTLRKILSKIKEKYRTVGNFCGVLIFVGPTQTTKNSLKICIDPRKYNFLGLKTTNLSLFHIMHIAMLYSHIAP